MKKTDNNKWSYQIKAAEQLARHCENPKYLGAVLAGAVSCGKTNILIQTLNIICKRNRNTKILFLAYSQTNLKDQTITAFSNNSNPVNPKFSFGTLKDSNVQVTIAIPQEFDHKSDQSFEYIVIDEAHQWFTSKSVLENIIQRYKIRKLILATGTPSLFNSYNSKAYGRKFAITYIAGEEMLKLGIYCPLDLDLVQVTDYKDTKQILSLIWGKAKGNSDLLERPIVVCKDIQQAQEAKMFLSNEGYKPSLATAEADPSNIEIVKFKNDETDSLVIVNRGILGLNIPSATMMVCLKNTSNIELLLQIMARMFRCHAKGKKKTFWMPATSADWNKKIALLNRAMSLNNLETMKTFKGKLPKDSYQMSAV
jgi:superfamily II DNA or RNA helicase